MNATSSRNSLQYFCQRILIALAALIFLEGCDGARGVVFTMLSSSSLSSGDGRPVEGAAPVAQYYRMVPGYTCGGAAHIYSQIDVTANGINLVSYSATDCSPKTLQLSSTVIQHSQLSPSLVGYEDGIFQSEAQPPIAASPQIPFPEAWCRSEVNGNAVIDISVSQDPVSLNYIATTTGAFYTGGAWQIAASQQQIVSRGAIGSQLVYTSPTLNVSADRSVAPPLDNGTFAGNYAGQNLTFNLQCRYGQSFDDFAPYSPSLAFDLLSGALPTVMNFARAGVGTFFDAGGNIQQAAANTPRFDYDPNTLAPLGLLVEESRTNMLTSSGDLTGAGWTNSGIGVYPSGTIAGITSYRVIKDNASDLEYWRRSLQSASVAIGEPYTVSFLAKPGNIDLVMVVIWQDSSDYAQVTFDVSGGTSTVAYQSGVTVVGQSMVQVGSAYRVAVTFVPSAALLDVGLGPSSTTYEDYIVATAAQLELGSGPTSWIPTTTTAATRGEDIAQITNMSWYSSAQGTFKIDVSRTGAEADGASSVPQALVLSDATMNQQLITYDVATGLYQARISVGGETDQWNSAASTRAGTSTLQSLLLGYQAGSASFQLNASITHDPSTTPVGFAPSSLEIGGASNAKWNGHFRSFTFWSQVFADSALETMGD